MVAVTFGGSIDAERRCAHVESELPLSNLTLQFKIGKGVHMNVIGDGHACSYLSACARTVEAMGGMHICVIAIC